MPEIKFGQYRAYEEQRIKANNAIMALLAGSQLASHTLKLTEGSTLLLPEIFPNVAHIGRFNLRTDVATPILRDAEEYLAAMAIPYALAIHEDFIISGAVGLLVRAAGMKRRQQQNLKPVRMHEEFEKAVGVPFQADTLELYHLLRLIRNSIIHAGGSAGAELVRKSASMSQGADAAWHRITGTSAPRYGKGDIVQLTHTGLVAALATTKRLARQANAALVNEIPRAVWASVAVEDAQNIIAGRLKNPQQTLRALQGFARYYYAPLGLTETELGTAARGAGLNL